MRAILYGVRETSATARLRTSASSVEPSPKSSVESLAPAFGSGTIHVLRRPGEGGCGKQSVRDQASAASKRSAVPRRTACRAGGPPLKITHAASICPNRRAALDPVPPNFSGLLNVRIAPFREDFITDGTDGTDKSRPVRNRVPSVKSVKSAVKFFWLRLGRAVHLLPDKAAVKVNAHFLMNFSASYSP